MAQAWYKVDNVAKVFLATTTRRDPRVFRICCTLTEAVEPDVLNEALRRTAQEWPQFQVTLHRGLFWHYFESTDQVPVAKLENKEPCAPLYVPERRNQLIYRVSYFGARINLEMFHAMTDGNGGFLFLKTPIQSPTRALAVCIISAAKRSSKILPRDIRRKRNRAFLLRICRQEVSR